MGSCIICGTSVDGRICSHHEEDVVFEFRGEHPNQLTTDRYYRGTVDGFAEFGVFVDIGDRVTGLLHRSELDKRLDSLDWDSGDVVFVKVQNVRDNGNIDLGWSIRQSEREFRGTLIDDPDWEHERLKSEVEGGDAGSADAEADSGNAHSGSESEAAAADTLAADDATASDATTADGHDSGATTTADGGDGRSAPEPDSATDNTASAAGDDSPDRDATEQTASEPVSAGGSTAVVADADATADAEDAETVHDVEPTEVRVGTLADHEGEDVRLTGVVADVNQTSGPTVFTIRDEEGTVECAAFVEAGVRAYPDVEEDDVVRLDGEVRRRRGEIQVETEALVVLDTEERETVETRMADALDERARPDEVAPLADDPTVDALADEVVEAATAIRRAVLTDRPVIVRHAATADGYAAGVALERATLPLVREEHRQADAVYHYFDRRPLEGGVYDMDDATKDTTGMLENRERHDEKLPLYVFVAAGGTSESLDGFELLSVYGAPRVVIDDVDADDDILEAVETMVSPAVGDDAAAADTTATTLSSTVAAHVNDDVRDELRHLPAVSYWDDTPEAYLDLAAEAGYDEDAVRDVREAVALEAFYQSYEDKRELITDLLFGDDEDDVSALAGNVAEQFRTKLEDEVTTAIANLKVHGVDDVRVAVLDTDAFTHRYDFPPATLLLDQLQREVDDVDAIVGVGTDALYLRGEGVDVDAVAWEIGEQVPDAAVTVRNTREGRLRFLSGKRDDVVDASLDVIADQL
mgnify:CR=1 FL=1